MATFDIARAVVVGIGATLFMDLWNLFLKRAFGVPSLDFCLLGRWLAHLPRGTFRHARIGAAAPMRFECALGWLAHYSIGVAFAMAFVALASPAWLVRPTLPPSLGFGLVTVVFPLFVLQPALGLGVASARAPHPARARAKSLATHAAFGLGLYLAAAGLAIAARASG
jgi:hypothetical protein